MDRTLLKRDVRMTVDAFAELRAPVTGARARRARGLGPRGIVTAMAAAIVACGTVSYLDEQRETAASRVDFAHEQSTLAKGIAAALASRLREGAGRPLDALRVVAAPVEEPGALLVLLTVDDEGAVLGTNGEIVRSARIAEALREGHCVEGRSDRAGCSVRLSHDESAAVGLPPRTSVAAFAGFVDPDGKRRFAVVATTARRNSDREERASARLVIAFVSSSVLVLMFGALALRTQRQELELERDLAIAEAVRDRDDRLGRADKMASLGAMATGIAHQVATPLGVILARVEQLLPKLADDRAQRAVVIIGEQTRRIESIVRAFLGVARGGTPAVEHLAPERLVEGAVGFVEHRFAEAGVELTVALDPDLREIACDPSLMEQALVNLLLNACDACQRGGHVEIAVGQVESRIVFTVTDDGEGIDPEAATRALEPFFTRKPEGRGTGLGLTIANEIVAHHHGVLAIRPRNDARGTCASIELEGRADA